MATGSIPKILRANEEGTVRSEQTETEAQVPSAAMVSTGSPPSEQDTAVSDVSIPLPTPQADDCIMIICGPDERRRFPIGDDGLTIGRDEECNVVLRSDSVSRKHARVERTKNGFLVADLGSTNGTLLNDLPLGGSYGLKHGDQIRIGRTIFKFLSGTNAETAFHEEIYRLTISDPLTSLPNKRALFDELERELSRVRRYNRVASVLFFDIDHFKRINDTYGHVAGDCVLKDVATRVRSALRDVDTAARYGGEEFVVILPESPLSDAVTTAERLRKTVESGVTSFQGESIRVTISIGCAVIEAADANVMDCIGRADAKLYEAKDGGRNRVCY